MAISKRAQSEMERFKTVGQQYKVRYRFPFAAEFQWERNRFIMDMLGGNEEMLVLDLGCGTGVMVDALASRFKNVVGIDISLEMMSGIDRSPRGDGETPVQLLQGDVERIPFQDCSFDLVVCRSILHHTDYEEEVLKDVFRILKPGGRIVVAEPMNDNPLLRFIRWKLKHGKSYGTLHSIDRAFVASTLRGMIRSAGFKIDKEMRYGFIAYPLCENPDLVPVLRYVPFRNKVAAALRAFDRFLAKIPLIKMLSWYGIMGASRPVEEKA